MAIDELQLKKIDGGSEKWVPEAGEVNSLIKMDVGKNAEIEATDYNARAITEVNVTRKITDIEIQPDTVMEGSDPYIVSIKEGAKSRFISGVKKLRINLQSGETTDFVPKESTVTGELYATELRRYVAKNEGYLGYYRVTVNLSGDDWDDLPDEIRVITPPVGHYANGSLYIDYASMSVAAYKDGNRWTNVSYPDGIIPIIELGKTVAKKEPAQSAADAGSVADLNIYFNETPDCHESSGSAVTCKAIFSRVRYITSCEYNGKMILGAELETGQKALFFAVKFPQIETEEIGASLYAVIVVNDLLVSGKTPVSGNRSVIANSMGEWGPSAYWAQDINFDYDYNYSESFSISDSQYGEYDEAISNSYQSLSHLNKGVTLAFFEQYLRPSDTNSHLNTTPSNASECIINSIPEPSIEYNKIKGIISNKPGNSINKREAKKAILALAWNYFYRGERITIGISWERPHDRMILETSVIINVDL